jgi:hypothetical protein
MAVATFGHPSAFIPGRLWIMSRDRSGAISKTSDTMSTSTVCRATRTALTRSQVYGLEIKVAPARLRYSVLVIAAALAEP